MLRDNTIYSTQMLTKQEADLFTYTTRVPGHYNDPHKLYLEWVLGMRIARVYTVINETPIDHGYLDESALVCLTDQEAQQRINCYVSPISVVNNCFADSVISAEERAAELRYRSL